MGAIAGKVLFFLFGNKNGRKIIKKFLAFILGVFLIIATMAGASMSNTNIDGNLSNQEFILEIVELHYGVRDKYDILTSLTVAQAIEESGWGKSNITVQSNNLFGIKGEYNGSSYIDAKGQKWRKYETWDQSVEDHARLLCNSNYNCSGIKDYKEIFKRLIAGNYCEGNTYTSRLEKIIIDYNLTQYDNLTNEELLSLKNNMIASVDSELDVVYFNQGDSQWSKHYFSGPSGGNTIKAAGCGPTSMAICISTLTKKNVTPIETCDWAAAKGYYVQGNGWRHSVVPALAKQYGLNCQPIGNSKQKLLEALSQKKLVVAIMGKGHFTTSGHYIVLRGLENQNVLVADCGSRARSKQAWNVDIILNEARKSSGAGGPFWVISN